MKTGVPRQLLRDLARSHRKYAVHVGVSLIDDQQLQASDIGQQAHDDEFSGADAELGNAEGEQGRCDQAYACRCPLSVRAGMDRIYWN